MTIRYGDLVRVGFAKGPILSIVASNYLNYINFKPVPYWQVQGSFTHANGVYEGKLLDREGKILRMTDRLQVDKVLTAIHGTGMQGVITELQTKRAFVKAPKPLILSKLQGMIKRKTNYTYDQILAAAEELYDKKKLISYPRTDDAAFNPKTMAIMPSSIANIKNIPSLAAFAEEALRLNRFDVVAKDRFYCDAKSIKGHPALRLTANPFSWLSLTDLEQLIIVAIARNNVKIFLNPETVDCTNMITTVNGRARFKSKGNVIIDEGWRKVDEKESHISNSKQPDESLSLPSGIETNDPVTVNAVTAKELMTNPTPLFNSQSIMDRLSDVSQFIPAADKDRYAALFAKSAKDYGGIGTSTTRGGIIEQLIQAEQILMTKKADGNIPKGVIIPSEIGLQLYHKFEELHIMTLDAAIQFEAGLQRVQYNEQTPAAYQQTLFNQFENDIAVIKNANITDSLKSNTTSLGKYPLCGADVFETRRGYFCANSKWLKKNSQPAGSCHFSITKTPMSSTKKDGKRLPLLVGKNDMIDASDVKAILTSKLTKPHELHNYAKGTKFAIAWKWDDQKRQLVFAHVPTGLTCPECGTEMLENKAHTLYFCPNKEFHKERIVGIYKTIFRTGKRLTKTDIKKLLAGQTITKKACL